MRILALVAVALFAVGCNSYVTPGRGADMSTFGFNREALTDASVQKKLELKPLASFPATLAVVRVQESGYSSYRGHGYGEGKYSIVTARDSEVETDATFNRIARMPQVTAIAMLNRMVLPPNLTTDLQLREAAATLHADIVLIYTVDSVFRSNDALKPLSAVTLGLSPNVGVHVTSTASAVLMDTRNGYVYAVAEATSKKGQLANAWTDEDAVDQSRRAAEAESLQKLVAEIERTWTNVVAQYTPARKAG
ncbi:MAG: hypothetical protein NTW19_16565 [Planctomycetota bacterium]|nr:hypothetical protein [Planctomycetota bacterium]